MELWGYLNLNVTGEARQVFEIVDDLQGFEAWRKLVKGIRSRAEVRKLQRQGQVQRPIEAKRLVENALACVSFTEWLTRTLVRSAYPGAPYERKYMALDVLNAVAETWGVGRVSDDDGRFQKRPTDSDFDSRAERLERSPYRVCLGADVTTALLGALVDSWDKLRVAAFTLLARHPSPLAGVTSAEEFGARARWALRLLRSPRVRESDAAALLMRLLLRKYAVDLGWDVTLSPEPKATATNATNRTKGETAARLLGERLDPSPSAPGCFLFI